MLSYEQVDALIGWLRTFDPNSLSEDDVETNFVFPLFGYLGYPNPCRRGKYPVNDYQPGKGKGGRKPEIDQIYFSVSKRNEQGPDTSLVLVEAKKPQVHDLEEAIRQAKYYGNHLTPIFLVITNGRQLIILKRQRFRGEEVVFDDSIQELLDRTRALEIYRQLQFELVKQLKEEGTDTLAHALYTELINASQRYPGLEAQLAKGDFEPSTSQENRRLTVIKPTVAITCELPIAFTEGSCSIEFSNIMLRGLTCHLSHSEILEDLLVGLGTSPEWKTRRFLERTKQGSFRARLGKTIVILAEREAIELCDAVDTVGQRYKDRMIESANILETWDYSTITFEGIKGCHLLSVERWLWDLMKEFSYEFDFLKGSSEWHIFDSRLEVIRLTHRDDRDYHAMLWPRVKATLMPSSTVDIIYSDCITELTTYDDNKIDGNSLFANVGPRGFWTATYTHTWIVQQFIPKVFTHYLGSPAHFQQINKRVLENLSPKVQDMLRQGVQLKTEQINTLRQEAVDNWRDDRYVSLPDITEPKQLKYYVGGIQSLFHSYGVRNIPASILRQYYAAFANLARYVDSSTIKLDYIQVKLRSVQRSQGQSGDFEDFDDILRCLDDHATRILEVDFEDCGNADLLSRVFSAIVDDGVFRLPQSQLNTIKQALRPLWDQCRFEKYFVEPLLLGY
jgi:hypothetical protein